MTLLSFGGRRPKLELLTSALVFIFIFRKMYVLVNQSNESVIRIVNGDQIERDGRKRARVGFFSNKRSAGRVSSTGRNNAPSPLAFFGSCFRGSWHGIWRRRIAIRGSFLCWVDQLPFLLSLPLSALHKVLKRTEMTEQERPKGASTRRRRRTARVLSSSTTGCWKRGIDEQYLQWDAG